MNFYFFLNNFELKKVKHKVKIFKRIDGRRSEFKVEKNVLFFDIKTKTIFLQKEKIQAKLRLIFLLSKCPLNTIFYGNILKKIENLTVFSGIFEKILVFFLGLSSIN